MPKSSVLIVDDIEVNRIILREILTADYAIVEASGGKEALEICNAVHLPDIILLDIMMPDMDGYEVLEILKKNERTRNIPVLFITAVDVYSNETKALNAGAVDFISKPFNSEVVKARVNVHVQMNNYRHHLEDLVAVRTDELTLVHQRILETLATIVEYRNLESGEHIKRVQILTRAMIDYMLTKPQYRDVLIRESYKDIIRAVTLHDIGKVSIPDYVLSKPGRHTAEEFEVMKTHSTVGGNIIDSISHDLSFDKEYLRHCKDIALYHHERWDGTGYMAGLKGEEIPISARIVSVIDVYDAVSNKRCYKEAFSYEESVQVIADGSGKQFDPGIVQCFMEIAPGLDRLVCDLRVSGK